MPQGEPTQPQRDANANASSRLLLVTRIFVLIAVLALTALAVFILIAILPVKHNNLTGFARVAAFPVAVWACGLYALLQSVRLALIAVLAPLLALLWWIAFVGATGFWQPPYDLLAICFLALMVSGAAIAALPLRAQAAERTRGSNDEAAAGAAFAHSARTGMLAMLGVSLGIAVVVYPMSRLAPAIGIGAALMLIACVVPPPLIAGLWPPNEAFIARMNRAREFRQRIFSVFALFAVPRWSFAIIGSTAVLTAIVCLTRSFAPLWPAYLIQYAVVFACAGLIGAIGLLDWRGFFYCGLPPFLAALYGAWLSALFGLGLRDANLISLLLGSSAGLAFIYALVTPAAHYRRAGDPTIIALARALSETGAAILILGVALALALLASALQQGITPAVAVLPLFHVVAALMLTPAIWAALDDLFPPRRSLEELYGTR